MFFIYLSTVNFVSIDETENVSALVLGWETNERL